MAAVAFPARISGHHMDPQQRRLLERYHQDVRRHRRHRLAGFDLGVEALPAFLVAESSHDSDFHARLSVFAVEAPSYFLGSRPLGSAAMSATQPPGRSAWHKFAAGRHST